MQGHDVLMPIPEPTAGLFCTEIRAKEHMSDGIPAYAEPSSAVQGTIVAS